VILNPLNANLRSGLLPYTPGPGAQTAEAMLYQAAFPLQFKLVSAAVAIASPVDYIEFLGRNRLAIQVLSSSGTYGGTVLLEVTLDGLHWVTLDTITTESVKQYTGIYVAVRASVSAYTSGTIEVFALIQRA
jgi:hypothetical protein